MKNVIAALRTFFHLALPYFRSHDRWRACGLLAGVVGSELFVVYFAIAPVTRPIDPASSHAVPTQRSRTCSNGVSVKTPFASGS